MLFVEPSYGIINDKDTKPSNVNWEYLCRHKEEGGTRIRSLELWNRLEKLFGI